MNVYPNAQITTDHESCSMLVEVLARQGVAHAVISPGSRNAPLIVAFAREKRIKCFVIVDERSAAFTALGIAQQTHKPVAVVCTSGSAVLNYAPAAAEAYYRHLPLIFISADRPAEWIDQNDSQTIRQFGSLANVVKRSFNFPSSVNSDNDKWWINRMANDAAISAVRSPMGPIHINVQLGEPLCGVTNRPSDTTRIVCDCNIQRALGDTDANIYAHTIASTKRVMIVASMCDENERLNNALSLIASLPNVIVLSETIANIHNPNFIPTIDRTLSAIDASECIEFAPQLLITFGGAPVTRMLKHFLRTYKASQHWRIGIDDNLIDTIQNLSHSFPIEPADFFTQIAENLSNSNMAEYICSDYAKLWKLAEAKAAMCHKSFIDNAPWCDLKAFSIILPKIPKGTFLQLSNGTPIRYAQLFDSPNLLHSYCNRGVAGIDGTTSTALGASLAHNDADTLLITGDMSLSYDLSGLASQYNSARFKIIVMCNGGGGIFRFINGPSSLPELEQYFEVNRHTPVKEYASAFGFDFFEAASADELKSVLPEFFSHHRASILSVYTPNKLNANILKDYFVALKG